MTQITKPYEQKVNMVKDWYCTYQSAAKIH